MHLFARFFFETMTTSNATSVTIQKRKRLQSTKRNVPSRSSWLASLLVFCASSMAMMTMTMTMTMTTMTVTNALVVPEPKTLLHTSFRRPVPRLYQALSNANRLISLGMSNSSADDDTKREGPPSETTTTTTADKSENGLQTSDTTALESTTEPIQDPTDLVDAIFKGNSPGSRSNNSQPNSADTTDTESTPLPVLDKIDSFLDKPFFDPDAYEEDDNSFFGKFARLVKTDYELFEAVFVACFFLLLITVTKDLLRAQMAANSVTSSGRLF